MLLYILDILLHEGTCTSHWLTWSVFGHVTIHNTKNCVHTGNKWPGMPVACNPLGTITCKSIHWNRMDLGCIMAKHWCTNSYACKRSSSIGSTTSYSVCNWMSELSLSLDWSAWFPTCCCHFKSDIQYALQQVATKNYSTCMKYVKSTLTPIYCCIVITHIYTCVP